uniref:Uncharacterized protein n=1 Tax=Romanomermis culicivorax TaxID=13658 RepID=A0A915HEL1_ROMCU
MWNLNKSVNALAICLHIDESTDICATKNLLIYLTICSKDAQYNGQFYGTLLELENECDATTIAHK